jgi:small subunit ribosomal protein S20
MHRLPVPSPVVSPTYGPPHYELDPVLDGLLLPSSRPHARAFSRNTGLTAMPNIKQQKKRVRITGRQRDENIRYRSTVKTLTKRLQAAVESGDADAISAEHRTLVRWVDRAASRGALHENTAARKKAQAARLVAGGSS